MRSSLVTLASQRLAKILSTVFKTISTEYGKIPVASISHLLKLRCTSYSLRGDAILASVTKGN